MCVCVCVREREREREREKGYVSTIAHFPRSKELIVKAIHDNDFLRNLEKVQISEIVDCMFQREFGQGQFICREGGVGTQLYVIAGMLNVLRIQYHCTVQLWKWPLTCVQ